LLKTNGSANAEPQGPDGHLYPYTTPNIVFVNKV